MNDPTRKIKSTKKDKGKDASSKETLGKMTQEELIDKILQLEAHNHQLKNILQKKYNQTNVSDTQSDVNVNKKIDFERAPKRHVLLKFYYFGWDYQGYVIQEDTTNTIEFFLFKALQKCCLIETREKSNYHRCGRTDKGVSAFCQVISIDLRSKCAEPNEQNVQEEFPYCLMLNRLLPDNIRCYAWAHVGSNVSSRFDCSSRTYKYYFPRGNLNLEAMQEGAKFLVGTHDFRNFCKMDVGNGVTEFERVITNVGIRPCSSSLSQETSGYHMLELVIQGKSFLWHQIRCIMSILLVIGQEKESPDVIKDLLNIKENPNKPQYSLANHLPLNLYEVEYLEVPTYWNIDHQDLMKTIELLQSQWTQHSVKCTMIRDMVEDLQKLSKDPVNVNKQAESLLDGVKCKVYRPLLSRMKCESLENKINHYIKRRKLEVVENPSGPP